MHSHFSVFSGYGSDLQLGIDNDNIKHQVENRSVEFSKAGGRRPEPFLGRSADRTPKKKS